MGFCLFNNVAVAAAHACDAHGLERIVIVDFDVHNGNGTQAIFERDPRIAYFSSHQSGLFRNSAASTNARRQHPQRAAAARQRRFPFQEPVGRHPAASAIDALKPQLLLVSAGFDAICVTRWPT